MRLFNLSTPRHLRLFTFIARITRVKYHQPWQHIHKPLSPCAASLRLSRPSPARQCLAHPLNIVYEKPAKQLQQHRSSSTLSPLTKWNFLTAIWVYTHTHPHTYMTARLHALTPRYLHTQTTAYTPSCIQASTPPRLRTSSLPCLHTRTWVHTLPTHTRDYTPAHLCTSMPPYRSRFHPKA